VTTPEAVSAPTDELYCVRLHSFSNSMSNQPWRRGSQFGALGQDLLSSSLSPTWVRKTISLPGRSGASRTSRTLNP
jgi:hypothetical protein